MPTELLTTGSIADKLDVKIHRVRYVIKSKKIEHVATAGGYRLYDDAALQKIRNILNL